MGDDCHRDEKAGQCECVTDDFDERTGGAEGWGRDIGATVVVHDTSDHAVDDSDAGLTDGHGSWVLVRIAHLGHNGEKA